MLGNSSQVVNGQLVNVAIPQGYHPLAFGQAYTGPAMWPRQGVYNRPPVMPSPALQATMDPGAYGGTPGLTGVPAPTAMSESGNPFHPTKSPLWWGLGFLAVGLLMLQHIHFKG